MAVQINGQLEVGAPAALSYEPISVPDLRERWLDHHEHVRRSSLQPIRRYRAATEHLLTFVEKSCPVRHASDFRAKHATNFVRHLRMTKVASNGHRKARKRPLQDTGIKFILETCSSLFQLRPAESASLALCRKPLPDDRGQPHPGRGFPAGGDLHRGAGAEVSGGMRRLAVPSLLDAATYRHEAGRTVIHGPSGSSFKGKHKVSHVRRPSLIPRSCRHRCPRSLLTSTWDIILNEIAEVCTCVY